MLQAIIRDYFILDCSPCPDDWRGCNGLIEVGYGKKLRVSHGQEEFVGGGAHIKALKASVALPDPNWIDLVVQRNIRFICT